MVKTSPVYELNANEYNTKLAEALKTISEIEVPEWSFYVKSGVSRVKPPQEEDFWFKRLASILRQAYTQKIIGVNRLRTRYGSKQNRGMRPEKFKKASGKMIRLMLQQAEAAGLLEKYNVSGKRAGRKLTTKGKEFMDNIGGEPIIDNSQKQDINEKKQEDIKIEEKPTENNENIEINSEEVKH